MYSDDKLVQFACFRKLSFGTMLGAIFFTMAGCQSSTFLTRGSMETTVPGSDQANLSSSPSTFGITVQTNTARRLVRESIKAIEERKLKKASQLINLALKLDVTNPDIQFFNGLVYHLMGVSGDSSKFELAEQGYKQVLKFDPGNLSANYQLGQLYMDQRRYGLAQGQFASVALHYGDEPAVLYSLATASYYARDPKTAEAVLNRLVEISPESYKKPEVVKAMTLAQAAMNDRAGVESSVAAYRKIAGNDRHSIRTLQRRVNSWQSFYDNDANFVLAQMEYEQGMDQDSGSEEQDSGSEEQGEGYVDSNMVVVDVVLIGTQEDARDSRGINLLDGLQLQFGDPVAGTPARRLEKLYVKDGINGANGEEANTRTIIKSVGIPSITYSLNIANSLNANNHVLAKPSLVAQSGETSEFFSGTEILAAAVSGGDGDSVSVEKEVGVKLAVTPEMLPNDMIRLHVVAERTFLTDPSNSVVFEFRLDTTKTNVNSTVTMKYGETLILGGLSEREISKSADGVPGLMDIPVVNLLFSEHVEREFERSILILMTPRRPQYTQRAASDRKKVKTSMSDAQRNIERLGRHHKDWFTPRSTFDQVIDKLQGQEFFEEFRIGDIKIQAWHEDTNGMNHIAKVRDRLLGI